MASVSSTASTEVFKNDLFKDTVWIVTGGGTGIGLEIALQAVSLGASIAICGRRKEPLEEAASMICEKASCDKSRIFYQTCA